MGISLAGVDIFAEQLTLPDANSVAPDFTAFPEHQAANIGNLAHVGYQHLHGPGGVSFDVSDHHVPSPTRAPLQLINHRTSHPIFEQTLPSRTASAQPTSRSSDNSIVCPHPECNGLQLDQASEWK